MSAALNPPLDTVATTRPTGSLQPIKHQRRKLLLPITLLLVATAWSIGRQIWYTPGSEVGYYMGMIGGIMLLTLLLYPLRKHVGFMQSWGASKHWFRVHMFLGITGPLLILLHSSFHVGSLNAGVALSCMLVVAGSGIIGRFFYTKIHNGLYGRRASLHERQIQLGISAGDIKSKFHFAPEVDHKLRQFEAQALAPTRSLLQEALHFATLGLRARFLQWETRRLLARLLKSAAKIRGWSSAKLHERLRYSEAIIHSYLDAVQDTAQFATYEKLFSLWHVLHVPFVYMLVISAIVHVIAVHMY